LILLATNKRDITSDFVALELERRKLPFFRLNTETLSHAVVSFRPQLGRRGWVVEYPNKKPLAFAKIRAAYLRRPEVPLVSDAVAEEVHKQYCASEWGLLLVSALRSLEGRWLNSPVAMLLAEDKPRQLSLATAVGFDVPETLITNNSKPVEDMVSRQTCIAKPLSSSLFGAGDQERIIFTTRLLKTDLINKNDIEVAPLILQHEIPKKFDIRVSVVGNRVFAAEIDSQVSKETEVDWRKGERVDLAHRMHSLPSSIGEKCCELTRSFGLKFSAIDLVLGLDGRYYFLEINPNGQWAWIEKRLGLRITEAIVDELVSISC